MLINKQTIVAPITNNFAFCDNKSQIKVPLKITEETSLVKRTKIKVFTRVKIVAQHVDTFIRG
jgi:hypothetical protein